MSVVLGRKSRRTLRVGRTPGARRSFATDRGTSGPAILVDRFSLSSAHTEAGEYASQSPRLLSLIATLGEYIEAAGHPGWDGYDAQPLDRNSLFNAMRLLFLLDDFELPSQVSVDPDGEVSMEWDGPEGRSLLASMSANGQLAFATIDASGPHSQGTEPFSDYIPGGLLRAIHFVTDLE